MKAILMKYKPEGYTREEWSKLWNNSSHVKDVMTEVIRYLQTQNKGVKLEDFDCPNHYAKIAYKEGKAAAYGDILDILQDKSSKPE